MLAQNSRKLAGRIKKFLTILFPDIMKTFKYCATHKADEAYMREMCHQGWGVTSLVEGIWTFERCRPDEFVYRVFYFRGMDRKEIEARKSELARQGIEFVWRYSFWGIFRSRKDFSFYNGIQEKEICEKMCAPMKKAAVLSWLLVIVCIVLTLTVSRWFLLPTLLLAGYGSISTWLALSYNRLIRTLH